MVGSLIYFLILISLYLSFFHFKDLIFIQFQTVLLFYERLFWSSPRSSIYIFPYYFGSCLGHYTSVVHEYYREVFWIFVISQFGVAHIQNYGVLCFYIFKYLFQDNPCVYQKKSTMIPHLKNYLSLELNQCLIPITCCLIFNCLDIYAI